MFGWPNIFYLDPMLGWPNFFYLDPMFGTGCRSSHLVWDLKAMETCCRQISKHVKYF